MNRLRRIARWVLRPLLGPAIFLAVSSTLLLSGPSSPPFVPAFMEALERAGITARSTLETRLLAEYGAMFVAPDDQIVLPSVVLFPGPDALEEFWESIEPVRLRVGKTTIELQKPAARKLQEAIEEARDKGLSITPRGGPSAARRSYGQSLAFWKQRVENGLAHWKNKGKIPADLAGRIRRAGIVEQAKAVLEQEARGCWYSTRLDRSILRSVAPPGGSQHHTMLALDVAEHDVAAVRAILERHGWFQTVVDDLPHFTYLGLSRDRLEKAGLTQTTVGGRKFWVPRRP